MFARALLTRGGIACALVLAVGGCVTGSGAGTDASSTSLPDSGAVSEDTYVDRDGFSIEFPPSWTIRTDLAGLQVVGTPPQQLASDFADNVGVLLEDTGNPSLTADAYVEASVETAPSLIPDFALVEIGSRGDAATMEYTGTIDQPLHFFALVRVADGKAFTATFTATQGTYDDGLAEALAIMDTLRPT